MDALRPSASQNFDIAIVDDALLQWIHMKATQATQSLAAQQPRAVAHMIAKQMEWLPPSGNMPDWAADVREVLRGTLSDGALEDEALRARLIQRGEHRQKQGVALLCGSLVDSDTSGTETFLRASIDKCLPVEQCGVDTAWPLLTVVAQSVQQVPERRVRCAPDGTVWLRFPDIFEVLRYRAHRRWQRSHDLVVGAA